MPAYFPMAAVVEALWPSQDQDVEGRTLMELASRTYRTKGQLGYLLDDLADLGLATSKSDRWLLTDKGKAWATDLVAATDHVARASRRNFRSFLDYHPKQWWPNGK